MINPTRGAELLRLRAAHMAVLVADLEIHWKKVSEFELEEPDANFLIDSRLILHYAILILECFSRKIENCSDAMSSILENFRLWTNYARSMSIRNEARTPAYAQSLLRSTLGPRSYLVPSSELETYYVDSKQRETFEERAIFPLNQLYKEKLELHDDLLERVLEEAEKESAITPTRDQPPRGRFYRSRSVEITKRPSNY